MKRCVIGVGPVGLTASTRVLSRQFLKLVERALTCEVALVVASSYAELRGLVTRGEVDVSWLPPALFVRCLEDGSVTLLACAGRQHPLCGAIFVREDAPWAGLGELDAPTVGWVDPFSCSGYLFPRLIFSERGLGGFAAEHHLGSHQAVARAVGARRVEVGATFVNATTGEFGWGLDVDCASMRVLEHTAPIPADTVCAAPSMSDANRARLSGLLLDMHSHETGQQIMSGFFGVHRFRLGSDEEYLAVERAIASLTGC